MTHTKFLKLGIIIFIFIGLNINSFAQDYIYKNDKTQIKCKIQEINVDETIIKYKKYDNLSGPFFNIYSKNVFMIKYENGEEWFPKSNNTNNNNLKTDQPITLYYENGITNYNGNNTKYTGYIDDNEKYTGKGILYFSSKDIKTSISDIGYVRSGTFIFEKYDGEFRNGTFNGFGVLTFTNGYTTKGVFENGFNGFLTTYNNDGRKIFEGNVVKGINNGQGTIYDENGNINFKGNFIDGEIINGTQYYENGNVKYTGDFKNNVWDGNGKYYDEYGNIKYDGMHKNGLPNGYGCAYDNNGGKHCGQFSNGKLQR